MTTDALTCPKCNWNGIALRGPLAHCSKCSHEWKIDPVEPIGIRSRRPRDLEIPDAVNADLKPNPFCR